MTSSAAEPIRWRDDHLQLLDQRKLPFEVTYLSCRTCRDVADAIGEMVVRGAPAIGVSAAYGVALSVREAAQRYGEQWFDHLDAPLTALGDARPTAVNLRWAIEVMRDGLNPDSPDPFAHALGQAQAMHRADIEINETLGEIGARYLDDQQGVLTHCNAGALATAGYGTALGVVRSAYAEGKVGAMFATETRPWLQGARLTAWELLQDGIDVTLVADGAAAALMQSGAIDWVIAGADRIAANGDVANKIGTYALATLAKAHEIKVMIVAPLSTIDLGTPSGAEIEIEFRQASEITSLSGAPVAAPGAGAWNPVFDVTPAHLIDVLVTEKGALERPDRSSIEGLFKA
ncbi:MAG: S-methyl-5-thioribose-1-phosphate isomerase [Pseudomonadota bacterium]